MTMMTRFNAVITVLVWFALLNESRAFSSRCGLTTRRTLNNDFDCKRPVGPKIRHPRRKGFFYRKIPDLSATNKNEVDQSGKESFQIPDKLLGTLVLLTVPLSWGTYVPVVRYLYAIQPPVPGFVFSACYYALAAITTTALAVWQSSKKSSDKVDQPIISDKPAVPFMAGIELGSYLFIANCLQITGLRTVESDRAGFLVQLTTVMVPFVEALFAGNLLTVPVRTWFACVFAFLGLFVMGLDGKAALLNDPFSAFFAALSSFTQGDFLIMGSAVLYTLHVVRLGAYARETTPMKLAASKATVETIFSILLVFGLVSLAPLAGNQSGLLGFAAETGKEIVTFFSSFASGLASGSIPKSALLSASGAVLWTGWVTCAYTIYAQSFGQSRVSPTNANLIYTFQPIFTALFAWLLLGETMGPAGFVGGAIIASAVYVVASVSFGKSPDLTLKEDEIGTPGTNKSLPPSDRKETDLPLKEDEIGTPGTNKSLPPPDRKETDLPVKEGEIGTPGTNESLPPPEIKETSVPEKKEVDCELFESDVPI